MTLGKVWVVTVWLGGLGLLVIAPVQAQEGPGFAYPEWFDLPLAHEAGALYPPARAAVRTVAPALPPEALWSNGYQSVQVNVDANGKNIVGDAANEPSLAVDPTNPNRIVIGWRQFDSIQSDFREAGWAYSKTNGRSWTFPGVLEQNVFRSDPVLAADAQGNFYYCSLRNTSPYTCQMFKSTNHGVSWVGPIPAYGGDKEWMEIDRTGGIGEGNLYVAWDYAGCCGNNWFTRSTDGGLTYMTPIEIPTRPYWGTVAIGPNGEVYISGGANGSNVFRCVRSSNAKDPKVTPVFELAVTVDLGGTFRYYLQGNTPNPEGLLGQVWIAVDRSDGPTRGYVYMLSSVDPPGNDPMDVMFARSTDGGQTWSSPKRINDDAPGTNAWQWYGTLAVAPNGRLDVIWNDTRNGGGDPRLSEVFYSSSNDGGATWSKNEPITPQFNSHLGWPIQRKLGDYYDMKSDKVGASVAYAATFNGEEDVYYLRIGDYDCNGNGIPDQRDIAEGRSTDLNHNGIPDECEGLGDLNCDEVTNNFDIDPFVLALTDPAGYAKAYPNCDRQRADINGDGAVDNFDIDPFVKLLTP